MRSERCQNRYVNEIEEVADQEANCIKVEGNLYLAGDRFITTHNTNLCLVIWPAWVWAQSEKSPLSGPQSKFMSITYGDKLSTTIAAAPDFWTAG